MSPVKLFHILTKIDNCWIAVILTWNLSISCFLYLHVLFRSIFSLLYFFLFAWWKEKLDFLSFKHPAARNQNNSFCFVSHGFLFQHNNKNQNISCIWLELLLLGGLALHSWPSKLCKYIFNLQHGIHPLACFY